MTAPTPSGGDTIADAIAKAIDEINRLCAGRGRMTRDGLTGRDWTMCIPHHDTDSDHVFAELVIACKRLQAENVDLREALAGAQLAARRGEASLRQSLRDDAMCVSQWFDDSWSGETNEPVYQAAQRLWAAAAATPEGP